MKHTITKDQIQTLTQLTLESNNTATLGALSDATGIDPLHVAGLVGRLEGEFSGSVLDPKSCKTFTAPSLLDAWKARVERNSRAKVKKLLASGKSPTPDECREVIGVETAKATEWMRGLRVLVVSRDQLHTLIEALPSILADARVSK